MNSDSNWYVELIDSVCSNRLIGIIRGCTIVIQVLLAKYVPNSYNNSLYIAKYMVLLEKIAILECFIVIKAIICSGNRGLAILLVN